MFMQCTQCARVWERREEFLGDPEVVLTGYQAHFEELTTGLFLFNHAATGCNTTLSVAAEQFYDLYQGPIFEERLTDTAQCLRHCHHADDLEPCGNKCECGYVRQVLQVVRNWRKSD